MFTRRFRFRRNTPSSQVNKKKFGSIFRGNGKKSSGRRNEPLIQPSRTIEMMESEDEMDMLQQQGNTVVLDEATTHIVEDKIQQESFVFTADELMKNELNHISQLAMKDDHIRRVEITMEDLKANFLTQMGEKDLEMDLTKQLLSNSLDALKLTMDEVDLLARELALAYEDLSTMEGEVLAVKFELEETKEELRIVSKTLMDTQHELHLKNEEIQKMKGFANVGQGFAEGIASFWPF